MKVIKEIYLVRHGSTDFNDNDLLQGKIDNKLNDKGRDEVKRLSEVLKDKDFEMIFHSPLTRAKQTAEILSEYHKNAKFVEIEEFVEIDLGDWEGHKYLEVVNQDIDFHSKWMLNPEIKIPGGESYVDVYERAIKGVEKVLNSNFSRILIVAHAAVNRSILAGIMKMDPHTSRYFRMKNASFSKFLIYENKLDTYSVVESWNNYSHLEK